MLIKNSGAKIDDQPFRVLSIQEDWSELATCRALILLPPFLQVISLDISLSLPYISQMILKKTGILHGDN